jgi:hypothetical protein
MGSTEDKFRSKFNIVPWMVAHLCELQRIRTYGCENHRGICQKHVCHHSNCKFHTCTCTGRHSLVMNYDVRPSLWHSKRTVLSTQLVAICRWHHVLTFRYNYTLYMGSGTTWRFTYTHTGTYEVHITNSYHQVTVVGNVYLICNQKLHGMKNIKIGTYDLSS